MFVSRFSRFILVGIALVIPGFNLTAQTNFAVLASDGAWTWYNDSRAIFHNGKLYFGYVRSGDGKTALGAFDLSTGQRTDLWSSGFTQLDDHNNPGLLSQTNGNLLAIYARHNSDQYFAYRVANTNNPSTPAGWNVEQTIPNSGAGMTYANPFQLLTEGGKIFNFCRNQNFNPTVYTSTNGGVNWSAPQLFIQNGGGSIRPYVKYSSNNSNRIDFLYTDGHPRDVNNSLYHMYYDGGVFYKTDGAAITNYSALPLQHDAGQRGSIIYQYSAAVQSDPNEWIPTGRAWTWEIASQSNGAPVCVFTVQNDFAPVGGPDPDWQDDRIFYYYARWTGSAWQKRFIAQAGRPLYMAEDDYAGGICVDQQNPNVVYISSNAQNPFSLADTTNVTLRANQRYELWRGITSDGGLTFSWTQITTNSTSDNLRPYIPRRNGGEQCVIWFRGTYTTYTSYACSVVGLFTTQVPPSTAASGAWINDVNGNWSEASNWTDNIVADGSGNVADFSTLNISANRTVILDSARTIGTLRFGDLFGTESWTINSSGNSELTLSPPASVAVFQNAAMLNVPITGVSGLTKSGPGTLILSGSNSLTGTLNLDTGSTSANDGAVRITTSAAIAGFTSPIRFRNNSGGNAVGSLQLDGSAEPVTVGQTFTIACRNNDTVPTFHSIAGTNTIAGSQFYLTGGTNGIYKADEGSALLMTAPIQYVGNLTAARTFTFFGAGTVSVNHSILNSTNGAPINLLKKESGNLFLNGSNSYAGTTTVMAGTLGGNGTIKGPVTVQAGGTLSPGTGIGTLTVSNTLSLAGTTRMEISHAPLTNDLLRGLTTVTYGGTLIITNVAGDLAPGDSFKLFQFSARAGGFASVTLPSLNPGLGWNTNGLTNGVISIISTVNPVFASVTRQGDGNYLFSGSGPASQAYQVVAATNLAPPISWSWIANVVGGTNGLFEFVDLQATNFAQRFYRMATL